MKSMNSYLIFKGNCRQAMEFYKKCFGGDLHVVTYAQMPGGCAEFPKEVKDLLMHARLIVGPIVLMSSDSRPDIPVTNGNNFSISISCENLQEIEKFFKAFGENAHIKMPLQETFFAARFGMLTDQFGVHWMFNLEKSAK